MPTVFIYVNIRSKNKMRSENSHMEETSQPVRLVLILFLKDMV
uniref:Uncharacterized protein n=1 Tax=Triticum urartu TaxID=4572 RepID=A0A8R7U9D0_TRIUA